MGRPRAGSSHYFRHYRTRVIAAIECASVFRRGAPRRAQCFGRCEVTLKGTEAFERLLRFFTLLAYTGGLLIVIGVVLGILISPGWTLVLFPIGAVAVAVGVRERGRGGHILVRLRAGNRDSPK
jgi:hypothetical protein